MLKQPILEYSLLVMAVCGPMVVVVLRLTIKKSVKNKDGTEELKPMGIGVRLLQLVALLVIVPVIGILALEGVLSGEGAGTLLGAVVGYALGGISAPVPKE